jgi:pilus assembly protein Flp/PilA
MPSRRETATWLLPRGQIVLSPVASRGSLRPMKKSRKSKKQGQTLVEYALILVVLAIVAIGVLSRLNSGISSVYSAITSNVTTGAASH